MTSASEAAVNDSISLLPAPVTISDTEWSEIAQLTAFPAEARGHLEWAITRYRASTTTVRPDFTAKATRSALTDLYRRLNQLQEDLETLRVNPRALVALTLAHGSGDAFLQAMNDQTSNSRLAAAKSQIACLADWFATAEKNIAKGPAGARANAMCIQFLIRNLDEIHQRFRGTAITRSTKGPRTSRDFIITACRIADPAIGPGSIDDAMKRQIKSHGGIAD